MNEQMQESNFSVKSQNWDSEITLQSGYKCSRADEIEQINAKHLLRK